MVLLVPQQGQDVDELFYCINYITLYDNNNNK